MDHDPLFKELLRTFFIEFIELFLPEVASYLDPGAIEFLDKEMFSDLGLNLRRSNSTGWIGESTSGVPIRLRRH